MKLSRLHFWSHHLCPRLSRDTPREWALGLNPKTVFEMTLSTLPRSNYYWWPAPSATCRYMTVIMLWAQIATLSRTQWEFNERLAIFLTAPPLSSTCSSQKTLRLSMGLASANHLRPCCERCILLTGPLLFFILASATITMKSDRIERNDNRKKTNRNDRCIGAKHSERNSWDFFLFLVLLYSLFFPTPI